jgi:tRNA G18 (ribose-2'-O)-methylase SpoU
MELDLFRGLRDTDYRSRGLLVAEGRIVAEKALEAGLRIRALVCVPSARGEWEGRSEGRFEVQVLPRSEIETLAGFPFHRGVLALAERPEIPALEPGNIPSGNLLWLWNVTDPDNLGTLIRSAAALGAGGVLLGPGCADPLGRKALRTSMGNALVRPLRRADLDSLPRLRSAGLRLFAAALTPDARPPEALPGGGPSVLVLGNEGWGLPAEVSEACDERVAVPMARDVDSLNVGAAGAILMYTLFGPRGLAAAD